MSNATSATADRPRTGLVRGPVADLGIRTANGATGTAKRTLHGVMVPFEQWVEIDSIIEGHFLEMFMIGSLDKTFGERRDHMRCILYHGKSGTDLGKMPIGIVTDLHADRTAAHYEVELFEGLPSVLLEGLEAGQYGTSVFYELVKPDWRNHPTPSAYNPDGLDELRVMEAKVIEFGPTPFPIYEGALAGLRSMTDDAMIARLADDPDRLAELVERTGIVVAEPDDEEVAIDSPAVTWSAFPTTANTATTSVNARSADLDLETPKAARRYARAAEYVASSVWAIHPATLAIIVAIIGERRRGYRPTAEEIAERIGERATSPDPTPADPSVAVIDIAGPIVPHGSAFQDTSSGPMSGIDGLTSDFRAAMSNPDVKAVLLNIDSPGGSVDLVEEFASEIRAVRGGDKPIVAVANTYAASAAYWIASAADEVVVSPSAEVGSIGVYAAHEDVSGAQALKGIDTTLVSAGKYKVEGNPFEPLSDDAREQLQEKVDAYYKMFVAAVAKGRGVTASTVESDFGQGRMVMASKAVDRGMADRVATFDHTLARLERTKPPTTARAATLDDTEPERSDVTTRIPSRRTRQRNYLEREKPKWQL